MHSSITKSLPVVAALASLFVLILSFQNCSNDASFNANPNVARPFSNIGAPRVGGNEHVIIQINEYPTNTTIESSETVVDFEVRSPNGEITDVRCFLDDEEIDCDPTDTVVITDLDLGTHTFTIEGENSNGETASETITWTIFETIVKVTTDFTVTGKSNAADILIVVDNSGSMNPEQKNMADRVSNLMDRFANLDYRISVITTDPSPKAGSNSNRDNIDGQMLEFPDGSYCIKPSLAASQAQAYLSQTIQRPQSEGSGVERECTPPIEPLKEVNKRVLLKRVASAKVLLNT